jgi:hypothetical protein
MQLDRCADQGAQTLDEAYEAFARRGRKFGTDGQAMLDLLAQLRSSPDERTAWGLTSHATLILLSTNLPLSPWYVKIFAPSYGGYHVEYLVPAAEAPWPNAYVRGEAETVHQAIEMIRTAMDRCGGWESVPLSGSAPRGRRSGSP